MIDDISSSGINLSSAKEEKVKNNEKDKEDLESLIQPNYSFSSFSLAFKNLLPPATQLFKKNIEFKILTILFGSWIIITIFEFIYALAAGDTLIISDGFFNTFKTISFLITCLSLLFTHVSSLNSTFIYKRIEVISALASGIFLSIVSVYMCLQALHLITEEHEIDPPIKFLRFLYVIKIIISICSIMPLSDYILHPSLQIKLFLWKKYKEWKDLNEITFNQLKECSKVLKGWNNHYENMNALCINLISDLFCSVMFIIFFYLFEERSFDKGYTFISILNIVFVIISSKPLYTSVIKILMQGKCEVYEAFYSKLNKDITYFEGCLGVKEIKFWMCAENDIKGYIKLYGKPELDRVQLKKQIHDLADQIELNCDFTIEVSE